MLLKVALATAALVGSASAQTYHRTAACPTLGCVFPPDQTDFIAGQVFDVRIEAQAPANGSAPFNGGVPTAGVLTISHNGGAFCPAADFFKIAEPVLLPSDKYNFTYYEDLYARDAKQPTLVNVLSKTYRHVALYEPGKYIVKLAYNSGFTTVANWEVMPLSCEKEGKKDKNGKKDNREAKNVILFIGDGMTTAMITAARLLGHKAINGKYQTRLALDDAPAFGLQMTHSLDSFITDSANSATALASGKKATVNGLNAYTDSTGLAFNDPKVETIYEMFRRIYHGQVGIVTTAYIADATPAAVVAHTSQRSQYASIITQFLQGVTSTFPWTKWDGVDVLFGGGAEYFLPNMANNNTAQYPLWTAANYSTVHNKTALATLSNETRALGMFTQGNLAVWLDRNVYKSALNLTTAWDGANGTYDLPGLKDMTLKAIDILSTRAKKSGEDTGFMLMAEAASIDKQMHVLDYPRALGDVLELDDTVRATLAHLKAIGELENTLVIVTADHGHGFDVYGSADTHYLHDQKTDRQKRDAVGTYVNSGLSNYQVANGSLPDNGTIVYGEQGPNFPVQWQPRYGIAAGMAAHPDMQEDFTTREDHSRVPAEVLNVTAGGSNYYANPADAPNGFTVNGTLPVSNDQGVHSLTDVPVYAWGPGSENFRGVMNSPDIAFRIAKVLDLGRTKNVTYYK